MASFVKYRTSLYTGVFTSTHSAFSTGEAMAPSSILFLFVYTVSRPSGHSSSRKKAAYIYFTRKTQLSAHTEKTHQQKLKKKETERESMKKVREEGAKKEANQSCGRDNMIPSESSAP